MAFANLKIGDKAPEVMTVVVEIPCGASEAYRRIGQARQAPYGRRIGMGSRLQLSNRDAGPAQHQDT